MYLFATVFVAVWMNIATWLDIYSRSAANLSIVLVMLAVFLSLWLAILTACGVHFCLERARELGLDWSLLYLAV